MPPAVDLTADDEDEELRKALTLSLGPSATGGDAPVFGPSERVDKDQSWALVPVQTQPANKDEHDAELRRAVEASMNMNHQEDHVPQHMKLRGANYWMYVHLSLYHTELTLTYNRKYRQDAPPSAWAEPAALITSDARQMYAAFLLEALFSVPQLRTSLKRFPMNGNETDILSQRKPSN